MYPHVNHVVMSGRLTRDPDEPAYTSTGSTKLTLHVAVNNRRQTEKGWKNDPAFILVECWNAVAESVAPRAKKGVPILFIGQVIQARYEKGGEQRQLVKFRAQSLMVLPDTRPHETAEKEPATPPDNEEIWTEDEPF